jgi:sulfate adenylyltransferase subunit 2
MLYSVGKDSAVMLHLARKAFYPAPPPFPLLHVDTTWKFQAMYELRDKMARSGMELLVYQNPEARSAASTRSITARSTPTCGRPKG